jgi:hypothetical protein
MAQTQIPTVDPNFKCFRGNDALDLTRRVTAFLATQVAANRNLLCRSVLTAGAGCGATYLLVLEWVDTDDLPAEGEFVFGLGSPAAASFRIVNDAEDGIRDALIAVKAELAAGGMTELQEAIIVGAGDGAAWLVGAIANPE